MVRTEETAHISMDSILNDVFAELYPGWHPNHLMVESSELPPIAHRSDTACGQTRGNPRTVSALRDLASAGLTLREASHRLRMNYTWISTLSRQNGIQFRRAPWGGNTNRGDRQ